MEDLNQIFYGGGDEEQKIAEATETLQKIAEEEGVDLNSLSQDQQNELLGQLLGDESGDGGDAGDGGEAAGADDGSQKAAELTPYDVHQELAKVAEAEGVDLKEVDRDDYNAAFDKLAEDMRDPSYFEKRAEEQQKVAEADAVGRIMAHSFHEELNKIAAGGKAEAIRQALRSAGRKASPRNVGQSVIDRAAGSRMGPVTNPRTAKAVGGGVYGAGAGAAGAGAAAAGRDKESALDDPSVQAAVQVLVDRGLIDG